MQSVIDYSALAGAILPGVVAIIVQSHWPQAVKALVAFVACLLVALAVTYLSGRLHALDYGAAAAVVVAVAQGFYQGFWRPTGLGSAIERATNVTSPPDAPR